METLITVPKVDDLNSETCHHIPCKIEHDGDAEVSRFFETTISSSGDSDLTASFRGRPLNGCKISVPEGYTCLVVKEHAQRSTEEEDRHLTATHKFDEFTSWNLDKQPTKDDPIQKALQWIDIAKILHQPITDEDSCNSQASLKGH